MAVKSAIILPEFVETAYSMLAHLDRQLREEMQRRKTATEEAKGHNLLSPISRKHPVKFRGTTPPNLSEGSGYD